MPRWRNVVAPILLALVCLHLTGCILVPVDDNRGRWGDRDRHHDRWSDRDRDGRVDRDYDHRR